jgi:hypothetical protein
MPELDKDYLAALAMIISKEIAKALAEITVKVEIPPIPPIEIPGLEVATEPQLLYVQMTNADKEYEKALPDGAKKVFAQTSDGAPFRVAWEPGHVADSIQPYLTIPDYGAYYVEGVKIKGKTLYFASSLSNKVVELEVWT